MSACIRCCSDTGLLIKDLFTPPFTRQKLYILGGAFFVLVLIIIIIVATTPGQSNTPPPPRVFRAVLGRCSLPKVIKDKEKGLVEGVNFVNYTHGTSIQELLTGKVAAMVWTVTPPCSSQHNDSLSQTMEDVQMVREIVKRNGQYLKMFTNPKDLDVSERAPVTSIIAINGGHAIDSRLRVLEPLALLGVKMIALASDCDTPWIDSSAGNQTTQTLGDFAKKVLKEMRRVGILVDLTGTSNVLQTAVLNEVGYPVVYSASNSFATMNSTVNVDDTNLELLKKKGGIVMVSFRESNLCTGTCALANVVSALETLVKKVDVDHVGLGGDFDVDKYPADMKSPADIVKLVGELKKKKWKEDDIDKVLRANFQRVLLEAATAAKLDDPGNEMYEPKGDFGANTYCYTDFDIRYK